MAIFVSIKSSGPPGFFFILPKNQGGLKNVTGYLYNRKGVKKAKERA